MRESGEVSQQILGRCTALLSNEFWLFNTDPYHVFYDPYIMGSIMPYITQPTKDLFIAHVMYCQFTSLKDGNRVLKRVSFNDLQWLPLCTSEQEDKN